MRTTMMSGAEGGMYMLCPFRKDKIKVDTSTTSEEKEMFMECYGDECPAYEGMPVENKDRKIERCRMIPTSNRMKNPHMKTMRVMRDDKKLVTAAAGMTAKEMSEGI